MYNETYEDYIRSILGYSNVSNDMNIFPNEYRQNQNFVNRNNMDDYNYIANDRLEMCYPEIYKVLYPMVQKVCMNNTGRITEDMVENMTNEVYSAFVVTENKSDRTNSDFNNTQDTKQLNIEKSKDKNSEDRNININREDRQNSTLRDLIKILILRDLLSRPRPPFRPPVGPRPPIGPRPPMGPRPPVRPRFMDELYENF